MAAKKKASKKVSKKTDKKTDKKKDKVKKKRITITSVVLAYLDKKNKAECKEIYDHLVLNGFPDTKFNKQHLAWYKYKIRKGEFKMPSGKPFPAARKKKEVGTDTKTKSKKVKKSKKAKK